MFGRGLFVLVWLIIGTGFLLPAYSPHVQAPRVPLAGAEVTTVAVVASSCCTECTPAGTTPASCISTCACEHLLVTAVKCHDGASWPAVQLLLSPLPPGLPSRPQPLPPKLPAV